MGSGAPPLPPLLTDTGCLLHHTGLGSEFVGCRVGIREHGLGHRWDDPPATVLPAPVSPHPPSVSLVILPR